jgi:uncharacterized protein YukE
VAGWGYDVVGALEATPGADELLAVARRVERVDAAALTGLGRRLASLADGMDDSMRAVAGGGDEVARAWQGPGADAFTRYAADFARAGGATGDAARAAQRELAELGRTLASLRDEVAGHVSDALDAAYTQAGVRGSPTADEVRGAVATPTARAQDALDRVEAQVAGSARRLRALTEEMTGWSRMRSPDAGVSGGASSRWADRQRATVRADEPVQAARITGSHDGDGGSGGDGDDSRGGSSGNDSGYDRTDAPGDGDSTDQGDGDSTEPGDGTGGSSSSGPGGGPPGKVGDWIRQATAILAQHGVPVDKMNPDDIATIIDHESGGDPDATNGWDSNAAKGTPSVGLMQTIGPTFDAHKLPGHGDIHDPVDNIIAGVRYAIGRYGSVSDVPGVEALARGHHYVGY